MKKLKQIAATLVSVILAGTVTVNASAAESMETPYRSPTLSSFPSNASLEDLEKASDNEDLRIISSPSRGANYKTRAAEAVALLRIYSTTGSGSSSSFTNLGHSWLMVTNLSGSTVNIAGINVAGGKSITASTWDESVDVSREHKGLWLNLDSKLNSNGINLQNVSIQLPLRQIDLNTVNTNIKNNDKWGYLTNCSTFASKIWNSIASSSSKVDAGAINTPASLAKNITKVGEAESYTLLKYNTSSPHYDSVYYGYPPIKSNNNN